jgi:signal transduction histidine kinase
VKGPRSLRRRILGAFLLLATVLTAVMVLSFHGVYHMAEDLVHTNQLEEEVEHLLTHPERLEQPTIEVSRHMTAYVGLSGAPYGLRERLRPLAPGIHELGDFNEPFADEEVHIVVRELEGRSDLLYMVLDASGYSASQYIEAIYLTAVGVALLMVCLVGASTGRALADMVIKPVTSLTVKLRSGSLDSLADQIDPQEYGEEVGVLAEALADAAGRLRGFVERERRFTANASHELRTPISVIRGAAELMEAQIDDAESSLHRPLARVQRAVAAMEETVDLFLALAREGELTSADGDCSLAEIVAEVVEHHRRYLQDKPVGVVVQVPESLKIEAPPRVLAIVLGNLVSNAFRRTLCGTVTVTWHDDRIVVADTGPGIPQEIASAATACHVSSAAGAGIGLSIVTALCERLGWHLQLDSAEGSGTRATLTMKTT